MALQQIEFITEGVDGEEVVEEATIPSTRFQIKIDGVLYQPVLVDEIEMENDGDNATVSDQCGHTERSRTTNKGWSIRVTGIVTGNDSRSGNLSLQMLRDVVAPRDTVSIRSDVISGEYEVSNTMITQTGDLNSINTVDTDGAESAFDFQLQLGESQSE